MERENFREEQMTDESDMLSADKQESPIESDYFEEKSSY